jgi:hypothetical protein
MQHDHHESNIHYRVLLCLLQAVHFHQIKYPIAEIGRQIVESKTLGEGGLLFLLVHLPAPSRGVPAPGADQSEIDRHFGTLAIRLQDPLLPIPVQVAAARTDDVRDRQKSQEGHQ